MLSQSIITELEAICGAANVRIDALWCAQRVRAITPPETVAVPSDRNELAALLKFAGSKGLTVTPVGGGTKYGCGGIARRADLAISTERLHRVIEYPASDLTITVEAGITMHELSHVLLQQGQMLPIYTPPGRTATLGGTLAANLSGPLRLGYGGWRDVVVGLQFATADGRLAKGGGRVVKNVAGYDLPKLFIGSFGTIGVITEVSLKVFPLPEAVNTCEFGFSSVESAAQASQVILRSPYFPQALELCDATANAPEATHSGMQAPFRVIAAFAGPEKVVERAAWDFTYQLKIPGCSHIHHRTVMQQTAGKWHDLNEFTLVYRKLLANSIAVKASLPLTAIASFLSQAAQLADNAGLSHAANTHAGTGVVYQYLSADNDKKETIARTSEQLVTLAERLGGRSTVEWFPLEYDGKMNPWGTLGGDFALMRQIKSALDPHGVLNPGRFYGGI